MIELLLLVAAVGGLFFVWLGFKYLALIKIYWRKRTWGGRLVRLIISAGCLAIGCALAFIFILIPSALGIDMDVVAVGFMLFTLYNAYRAVFASKTYLGLD